MMATNDYFRVSKTGKTIFPKVGFSRGSNGQWKVWCSGFGGKRLGTQTITSKSLTAMLDAMEAEVLKAAPKQRS